MERVTFTEVTQRAVVEALQAPRPISEPLVEAHMARRYVCAGAGMAGGQQKAASV